MLAFFAGKSEFPVRIVTPSNPRKEERRGSAPEAVHGQGTTWSPVRPASDAPDEITEWLQCIRLQHRFDLTSRWSLVFAQPSSRFGLAWLSRSENNFVCVADSNDQHVHLLTLLERI